MRLKGAFAGRRNAAVGKAFYVRELRGQLLACKWPKKRGRPLHPTTLEQNERFTQANKMAQYAPASVQMAHRKLVEGTGLLPRDMMISSMMGRGWQFLVTTGRKRYPVAALQDLSDTLDILGALAGDIIGRGPELWQHVRPTDVGQVLTSQGPGVLPAFQAAAGGGGGWTELEDTTLTSSLSIGERMNVDIPGNAKQVQIDIYIPFHATGYRPVIQMNDVGASEYNISTLDWGIGPALTKFAVGSVSGIRFYRNANTPDTGMIWGHWNFFQPTDSDRMNAIGQTYSSTQLAGQMMGQWQNPSGVRVTKIGFQSQTGVGLQSGTRVIARAVLS